MKELNKIKYWIFDLDNTLYSANTNVFGKIDKKMCEFIMENLKVPRDEALKIKNISQSSITGGMSFAGGPLNSYVLNSTVQMIRKIRSDENKCGIVTGISGMMTKQSFALWGKRNLINYSFKDVSEEAENHEVPYKISSETSGEGNIIGYTIIKNKESVKKAVIYIEDVNKNRNIITSENKEVIESMEINEWVGKWIKFKNLLLIV